ncbi:hypothetical protein IFM89_001031 [Coptis chinensis]|uniref:Lactate/malate dehydrogenase C-terminal domain-containing protein n=1 Tax=Coptis chinensis TaxID=261450 RepID=A0A835GWS1_9MAGN|nr:hypothetical protein IFM89_001031 [Coptis chinensis]
MLLSTSSRTHNNSTLPIAAEILKQKGVYNPKKLFGVTTLDVVRANTFVAQKKKLRLIDVDVPVVGGHLWNYYSTFVVEDKTGTNFTGQEIEELGEDPKLIWDRSCRSKGVRVLATLSMAYAAARFVESSLRARMEITDVYECSFDRSSLPSAILCI